MAVRSWWEAFYRTGSIIFGGGQARPCPSILACQQSAVLHDMSACHVAYQGFGVTREIASRAPSTDFSVTQARGLCFKSEILTSLRSSLRSSTSLRSNP